METNQAVSHVEFFAKACDSELEVRNRAVLGYYRGSANNHTS